MLSIKITLYNFLFVHFRNYLNAVLLLKRTAFGDEETISTITTMLGVHHFCSKISVKISHLARFSCTRMRLRIIRCSCCCGLPAEKVECLMPLLLLGKGRGWRCSVCMMSILYKNWYFEFLLLWKTAFLLPFYFGC